MDQPEPSYRREFAKSPHHAWLGLLTVGAGFMTGMPLFLLGGVTAYALGWIYLPDLDFFRNWVDKRRNDEKQKLALMEIVEFRRKREALMAQLGHARRERYAELSRICGEIERITNESPLADENPDEDPRLRKLDELMWTCLRLLSIEQSLDTFLEVERRENVPRLALEAEGEVNTLKAELESLKAGGSEQAKEAKKRLLDSCLDRLDVLRKRLNRIEQAQANLSLVVSEQERLEHQIKLIRADAMATKNAQSLSTRINATVEHLEQTNRWISELGEFNDLVGELPSSGKRVGYTTASMPPPLIDSRMRPSAKVKGTA